MSLPRQYKRALKTRNVNVQFVPLTKYEKMQIRFFVVGWCSLQFLSITVSDFDAKKSARYSGCSLPTALFGNKMLLRYFFWIVHVPVFFSTPPGGARSELGLCVTSLQLTKKENWTNEVLHFSLWKPHWLNKCDRHRRKILRVVYSRCLSPGPGQEQEMGLILCKNHSHWMCLRPGLDT